jgi:uncharacterized protein (TIGR02145 family)
LDRNAARNPLLAIPLAVSFIKKNKKHLLNKNLTYMKNKTLLMVVATTIIALSTAAQEEGTFTDSRDSKIYKTVKIGTQTWMAENLAYKTISGCWAYSDNEINVATYGYLYDWETAKGVCPTGWYLPTNNEWEKMTTFLGGDSIAGGKLKETGTTHWSEPNTGATNETGFTALPSGNRGIANSDGFGGFWWSATENPEEDEGSAFNWFILYNESYINIDFSWKEIGYSVRCVKD